MKCFQNIIKVLLPINNMTLSYILRYFAVIWLLYYYNFYAPLKILEIARYENLHVTNMVDILNGYQIAQTWAVKILNFILYNISNELI